MSPRPSRPPVPNVLSPERAKAVREAERLLSTPQHETINHRRRAVNANPPLVIQRERRLSNSSKGEGPSRLKGKGINPKEWGNADFFEGEVDLEAQHAALESWKAAQAWARTQSELTHKDVGSRTPLRASRASVRAPAARVLTLESSSDESDSEPKKTKKTTRRLEKGKFVPKKDRVVDPTDSLTDRLSRANPVRALVDKAVAQPTKRRERRTTPRAMEPVEQVNPKSYIGLALKRLAKGKGPASSSKSSSSTSSTSGDSSSDSDSSTSSGSDSDDSSPSLSSSSSSTSGRRRHRRRNRSKGNRRSGHSRRASKKRQKS